MAPTDGCRGSLSYNNGSVGPGYNFEWTLDFDNAAATVTLDGGNRGRWSESFAVADPAGLCAKAQSIAQATPEPETTGGPRADASVAASGGVDQQSGTANQTSVQAAFGTYVPESIRTELQRKYDASG